MERESIGDYSTVLVAGATGGTGRAVVERLRSTPVHVRGMTRSEENVATVTDLGADEVFVGDLLSADDAAAAVEGCDAVICAVGSTPGPGVLFGDLVDGTGVVNLVDAATAAGVDRFVLVSSIGVGNSKAAMPLPLRAVLRATGILAAKDRAERHLRDSGLAFTILRPGGLTDDDPDEIVVGEGGDSVAGTIPRVDVARLCVAALVTPESVDRTFEIVSRDGLRSDPKNVVEIDWGVVGG